MKGRYVLKKFSIAIPIMILVFILSLWMLGKEYSEIDLQIRVIISAGAGVLSGIISYFLFTLDKVNK
jgi:hypothetical protein